MTCDPRFLPIVAFAQASHLKFWPRGPFVSISLAQWAVESAYGAQASGKNNFFGVKATPAQIAAGTATKRITKEYVGGAWLTKDLYFADYGSLTDCFDAHAFLLTQSWYKACMAATTPRTYAQALHADGYATAPNYAAVLIEVMDANDLYQFDQNPGTPQGARAPAPAVASPTAPTQENPMNFSMSALLKYLEDFPFAQVGSAVVAGGTNIPLDVAAAEAIVKATVQDFFSTGGAPAPTTTDATTAAVTTVAAPMGR